MNADDRERLARAVTFAAEVHEGQRRKGSASDAPYLCHLLIVAGEVLEYGGTLEQAIAGLLHDAIEDSAEVTAETLGAEFGAEVARMVSDCTDTLPGDTPDNKSPWRERKERYLEHLKTVAEDSLLVSACDKRHNLCALVGDLRADGLQVLEQFKGTPQDQVWYYQQLSRQLMGKVPRRLALELDTLVQELSGLIQASQTRVWKADEAP